MYRLFAADDLETPLACLSGCNGVDDASFFICTSGEYRVQAQIVDVTTSVSLRFSAEGLFLQAKVEFSDEDGDG